MDTLCHRPEGIRQSTARELTIFPSSDSTPSLPPFPTSRQRLKTNVTAISGTWRCGVSARTGWTGIRILWVGGWVRFCSFCLSVAACIVVCDPSLRHAKNIFGTLATNQPTAFALATNQPNAFVLVTNQPTAFALATEQPNAFVLVTNQPTAFALATNQPAAFVLVTNQPTAFALATNQPANHFCASNQRTNQPTNCLCISNQPTSKPLLR